LHLARIEAGNTQSRPRRRPFRSVGQAARVASRFALTATLLGFVAGCGNNYRPVVSAINPVGPAGQPNKYAVVISNPSSTAPGLVTFVDFSGDTVVITANIGVNPYYLVLSSSNPATTGYTLNSDGTLTSFSISNQLLASDILQTTLLPGGKDCNNQNILPVSILPQAAFTYVSQPNTNTTPPNSSVGQPNGSLDCPFTTPPAGRNSIAEFTGSPLSLQQELPVDTNYSPIYVAGIASAPRSFAISQAVNGGPGQVNTIENTTTPTIDTNNPIKVGVNPVYGVMTADGKRVFVMNQGDGTVSVINAQTNALDVVPAGATNPIPVGTSPLWADFAPTLNELVVANAGDGVNPGSVSIVSIPLCTVTAQISNPNCDPNNPVDANGFGTVVATVPVGINPRMVGVLQDGSRAYVINAGNPSLPCGPANGSQPANCTVSVINLTTNTVSTTIPLVSAAIKGDTLVGNGHPNYIAVTTGTPTGKVYVTSPDTDTMTVIRTDTDAIETTVPLQGKGISVRVTAP
jgi:YVTN family beta-propeller protein